VDAVSGFEDVHVHRFTDDGKYLICFSRNQHDLVVYRFRGFGEADRRRHAEAAGPRTPSDARGGDRDADQDENKPPRRAPATTRDKYFDLLYTRPLTVDADLLARDFAVTILEGEYLLVASSTPAEAPPRDAAARERTNAGEAGTADGVPARGPRAGAAAPGGGGGGRGGGAAYETTPSGSAEASASADASAAAARASGAAAVARARAEAEADTAARRGAGRPNATTTLPGSPTMDTVALHLVRLRDGRVCDRRVYRDDYVRLRRAAAVSVFAETKSSCLVSVLSLRWQAFRVLRVSLKSVTETETERAREVAAPPGSSEGDPSSISDPANGGEDDPIAVFADARTPVGSACAPDDDAPLAAQDQAEREWRLARRRDILGDGFFSGDDEPFDDFSTGGDSAEENLVETPSGTTTTLTRTRTRGGNSSTGVTELRGWSDPESLMYAGIKQKLITRVLLEARRRDAEAAAAEAREAEAHMSSDAGPDPADVRSSPKRRGVKRDAASAFVPSVSAPPTEAERLAYKRRERLTEKTRGGTRSFTPPRRGAFTSAFFSRYWSYAEWMVLWHVQLLDERRALLRFGTAEDVLAWGTRRSRAEAGVHPGSERCPESVLIAVMDWVEGTVEHVGDAAGAGGGLLGVAPENTQTAWNAERAAAGAEGGVPGEPAPPQAEGSAWQRLAAGAGGVGGPKSAFAEARRGGAPSSDVVDPLGGSVGGAVSSSSSRVSSRRVPGPNPAGLEPGFRWQARPSSQGHWSPSPYFDTRLFRYDARAAAPDERPRPAPDVSLRFSAAVRRVRRVEARVKARERKGKGVSKSVSESAEGTRAGESESPAAGEAPPRPARGARFAFPPSRAVAAGAHARVKRTITHVFHPVYPFAMSVSQAFMQPQVVSFHLRWDGESE
jgi:hypothetical protein